MGRKGTTRPVDYFGNIIEVGDAYFYGSPPRAGKVTAVKTSTIELTYFKVQWDHKEDRWAQSDETDTMTCGSPEKGVCLDKTIHIKIT